MPVLGHLDRLCNAGNWVKFMSVKTCVSPSALSASVEAVISVRTNLCENDFSCSKMPAVFPASHFFTRMSEYVLFHIFRSLSQTKTPMKEEKKTAS